MLLILLPKFFYIIKMRNFLLQNYKKLNFLLILKNNLKFEKKTLYSEISYYYHLYLFYILIL